MIKEYYKKPIHIKALQYNGKNLKEVEDFVGDCLIKNVAESKDIKTGEYNEYTTYIAIKTLEGDMKFNIGDYIIKGVDGEFYPCKKDIFEKTYNCVKKTKKFKGNHIIIKRHNDGSQFMFIDDLLLIGLKDYSIYKNGYDGISTVSLELNNDNYEIINVDDDEKKD